MDRVAFERRRGFAAIGLHNPRHAVNVGAAMRAAGCFGASLVVVSGLRFKRSSADTQAAHRHLPLIECDDVLECLPVECVPVAVEITDSARSLVEYAHPRSAFYIFGPEDGSICDSILSRCRDVVSIPSRFCLNLAATVNVVLYDRLSKQVRF